MSGYDVRRGRKTVSESRADAHTEVFEPAATTAGSFAISLEGPPSLRDVARVTASLAERELEVA